MLADNTVLVPPGATITGIRLNIRDEASRPVRGTIYYSDDCGTSFDSTDIFANVGPGAGCCATGSGSFTVSTCTLISVRFTSPNALERGAAAIIYLTLPSET